jgi:aminopeptidase N
MEEVSGINLTTFFNQWLYNPGILDLEGQWYYDKSETEIVLEMKQVQAGEILIEMPIEIAIYFKNNNRKIKKIKLSEAYRKYRIKVNEEPTNVSLDPNLWVLMNSSFRKKAK